MTAAAHKLARVVYNLARFGAAYVKQTEAAFADQVRARTAGRSAGGPGSSGTR